MFEASIAWMSLDYKERLIATVMFLELSTSGGVEEVDSDKVMKETCLPEKEFLLVVQRLFEKDLLDTDEDGQKLKLAGHLLELYRKEVVGRRGQ